MELDMYAETLIHAYEHPKHRGVIADADASAHEENISCGDRISVYIRLAKGLVADMKFEGTGCVISMASADLLLERLKGESIKGIMGFGKDELLKLINIDPGPVRLHCATLSLRAVRKAVLSYQHKSADKMTKEL